MDGEESTGHVQLQNVFKKIEGGGGLQVNNILFDLYSCTFYIRLLS